MKHLLQSFLTALGGKILLRSALKFFLEGKNTKPNNEESKDTTIFIQRLSRQSSLMELIFFTSQSNNLKAAEQLFMLQ
jgi:hypothetical protein